MKPKSHSQRISEQRRSTQDRERGTAHQRGYGSNWRRAASRFLALHPVCARCGRGLDWRAGARPELQGVVDHIVPHRGDRSLFWDQSNWQALCKVCHDRKTALEDGAFGRRRKA